MPFEKGHKINEGNHNVGRKSARDESAKNRTIKKAWELLEDGIEKEHITKVALPVALKDMKDTATPFGDNVKEVLVKFIDGKESEDNRDTDRV